MKPRVAHRTNKLLRLLRVPSYRRALRLGVAAAVEHDRVALPNPRTVIDVGANRGQFALVAARRWPDAALLCFEPLAGAAAKLVEVLPVGRVQVRTVALSDRSGRADLHLSRREDSSSLHAITPRQVAAFPGTEEAGVVDVELARLDDLVEPAQLQTPVLLKIDVQGAELAVLRGAAALLDGVEAILVECSFSELYADQAHADEVIRFLHERGFSLKAMTSVVTDRSGVLVQADLLFSRPTELLAPRRGE